MRQTKETNEFARRMAERPVGKSLTDPYHDDPPYNIAQAMGGREFFFKCGAKGLHRIGIFLGLGWQLPYGEAKDGIDTILVQKTSIGLDMQFLHAGEHPISEAQPVRGVGGLQYADLRRTFEEETGCRYD